MTTVIAVSGYKKSGKTTLCRKLLAELSKLGVRTGYIKRTADEVRSDKGTDTGSVAEMGLDSVLWGKDGLRFEAPLQQDVQLQTIAARYFPDAELLILEGGKELNVPKIWVRTGDEEIPDFPGIFLTYDRNAEGCGEKLCGSGSETELAKRLAQLVRGSAYRSAQVYIGDRPLPMKDFVADFVRGGIIGMLSSLKGGECDGKPVRVYLDGSAESKDKQLF